MRVPQVSERIKEAPAQALRGVFAGIGQLLLISDKLRNKAPADVPRAGTPGASETASAATVSEPTGQPKQPAEPARATQAPAGSTAAGPSATKPTAAAPAPAESVTTASAPASSAPASSAPAGPSRTKSGPAKPASAKPAPAKPARAQAAKSPKPVPTKDFDKTGNVRLISDDAAAAPSGTTTPSSAPEAVVAESEREDSAPPVPEPLPVPVPVPVPNYDELSIASLRARLRSLDVAQVRQLAAYERAHAGRADVIAMFERRIVKLEAEAEPEAEA